ADEDGFCDALGSVASDVASNFAASGGMADVDRVVQIERFDELREIVGVSIPLIAFPRLTRTSVPAAIVRDAAEIVVGEKKHLVLKRVGIERPAVAENDGLSVAPIFVIEIDVCGIFLADGYEWHGKASFVAENLRWMREWIIALAEIGEVGWG